MAPEALLEGNPYDGRKADVWSLGVLLCNLLARGEYPFVGRDEESLRRSISSAPPRLPASVSDACAELLGRMLEKAPARRVAMEDVRRHPWFAAMPVPQSKDPMAAPDLSALMGHLHVAGGAEPHPHPGPQRRPQPGGAFAGPGAQRGQIFR